MFLTRSFRFGEGIAELATRLIRTSKTYAAWNAEKKELRVVGCGAKPSRIGRIKPNERLEEFVSRVREEQEKGSSSRPSPPLSVCFISRTNAELLRAMDALLTRTKLTVGVIGGLSGTQLGDMVDVALLWGGGQQGEAFEEEVSLGRGDEKRARRTTRARREIASSFVSSFSSIDAFRSTVRAYRLESWCSILDRVAALGHEAVVAMGERCMREERGENKRVVRWDKADVVFATVHKSKGLEFEGVFLGDDFPVVTTQSRSFRKGMMKSSLETATTAKEEEISEEDSVSTVENEEEEELNLLYVAATRAKTYLVLPMELEKLMNDHDS